MLKDSHRVTYAAANDPEVLEAFRFLSRTEGIIPALESAHAVAYVMTNRDRFDRDDIVVINLSGQRGQGCGRSGKDAGACSMSRIDKVFEKPGTTAFIGFTVAGDPDEATSLLIAKALIDGGTDILELGVPFSDPVADGPTIQRADDRALAAGTTPDTIFRLVKTIRAYSDVPIVFLTYYNIVYRRGIERFYHEAREAGVDGILIADMPVEESGEVTAIAARYGIDPIFLIAQTTGDSRIRKIAAQARGYLYLVSVLGVTGVRDQVSSGAIDLLHRVRSHTDLPLALGFGISTPDHASTCAAAGADGVIVGSAIVDIIEQNLNNPQVMEQKLRDYVMRMKRATGSARIG